ncbi:MAG: DMT family transporter, partial [Pseudomonadota bacterium]
SSLHVAGILAGVSLVLYAGALIFTDVVRALLLYYLTPIWSTLLAWMVLGEPISRLRWVTIGLGALGLGLLLRIDAGLIAPFNTGDWMGFGAGLIWAMAAVWMRKHQDISGTDFTLSYFLWGSVAACVLVTLSFASGESAPTWTMLNGVLPWLVPLVVILVIPPAFAVMWGATVLSPGLLAILFMTEISVGTVTAALFAQEPLGWREVLGVLVISAAGVLEPVMAARNIRKSRV